MANSIILIVDDEEMGRETLEILLAGQGYDLAFAGSGTEALTKAAELTPDLILLDVMMPEMNGFEVCRRLRADPVLAEAPVILVTALDDSASRLKGLEAGADDFISKPFDRVELQTRVRSITRLNRYRRLLTERSQRRQAEEAERLKDEFVSNVSHELRTPLSVITLLSGNLDALYDRLDDEKRRQMIRDIRKQARILNELVGNVLDLSRLDRGVALSEPQWVNLAQLAQEETERLLPLAQEKSQSLSLTGVDALIVQGDDGQLRQAIRNLLNNAIKYTPTGGRITCECLTTASLPEIETHPFSPQPLTPNPQSLLSPWAVLRIEDTGIGISPADLPHLFERFYRSEPQSSIPGAGLGLAIVRKVIEQHAGHVTVASTPGVGSVFTIYLPLVEFAGTEGESNQ